MTVAMTSGQARASTAGRESTAGQNGLDRIEARPIAPGFVVIALHGLGDRALVTDAIQKLPSLVLSDSVLVDLSGLTLVDPDVLKVLVTAVKEMTGGSGAFCLLCSRLTGRLLLSRSGVADNVPIFATVADALQAQVHHQEGYGEGWTQPTERRRGPQRPDRLAAEIDSRRAQRAERRAGDRATR